MDRKKSKGKGGAGSIAKQFLAEDADIGFTKDKYETQNERLRRMGDKKKRLKGALKVNKRSRAIQKSKGKK